MPNQPRNSSSPKPSTRSFRRAVSTSGFSMMSENVDQPGIVGVTFPGDRTEAFQVARPDSIDRRHAAPTAFPGHLRQFTKR